MLRIQLHIETVNWFSPKGDDTSCGHVMLKNKFKNEFDIKQAPQEIAGFFV